MHNIYTYIATITLTTTRFDTVSHRGEVSVILTAYLAQRLRYLSNLFSHSKIHLDSRFINYLYIYIYKYIYVCIYAYIYIYIHMPIFIYICIIIRDNVTY